MASSGDKALSGAAAGAAAGTAVMPGWGTAIGGVIGGIGGYLQGDDPTAPKPIPVTGPGAPGGYSGQYGGQYFDPTTMSTQQLSWGQSPFALGQQVQNQSLYNQVMGIGNQGINNDLGYRVKQIQDQLGRLQGQQGSTSGVGSNQSWKDFFGAGADMWTDSTGKPIDTTNRAELMKSAALQQAFMTSTADHHNTYGKGGDDFYRWVQDAAKNAGVPGKETAFNQNQNVNLGNSDQRNQAIQDLQSQLKYYQGIQQDQGGSGSPMASNNPLMNFLNQRNTTSGKDYTSMYKDPNQGIAQGEADYYRGLSHQNIPGYNANATASSFGLPDIGSFNSNLQALYGGNIGGTMMSPIGPYQSQVGDFINNLNRQAEKSSLSSRALQQEQAGRRGLMGGSSEVADLAAAQGIQDSRAANAAQGYQMDQSDRQNWFNRKFAVDSHNSDVARLGVQGKLSLSQAGFANQMSVAQLLNSFKQQAFQNNQGEQQRTYNNMMGSTNLATSLGQNTLNNQRTEEGLDQQNHNSRMNLLNMLSGNQNQANQYGLQQNSATLQGAGLNQNTNQFMINGQMGAQAANTSMQNSYNNATWQQQLANNARNQNSWNQMAGALGSAAGSYMNQANPPPDAPAGPNTPDTSNLPTGGTNTLTSIPMPGQPH